MLKPNAHQAQQYRQAKERNHAQEVAPFQASSTPPRQAKQDDRQRRHGRLAQQRQREPRQGKAVPPPPLGVFKARVGQQRQREEKHGQRVLSLGYPGHRFHVYGVHGKNRRRQPCPGDLQPRQHAPEQDRAQGVQQHIGDVVAHGVHAP